MPDPKNVNSLFQYSRQLCIFNTKEVADGNPVHNFHLRGETKRYSGLIITEFRSCSKC